MSSGNYMGRDAAITVVSDSCTSDLSAGMRAYVTNLHQRNGPARLKKKYPCNKSILSISVYCTCQREERLNGKLVACKRVN